MTDSNFIHVFDVRIDNVTMACAIENIEQVLNSNRKVKIYFANAFYLNCVWNNDEHWKALKHGDYIFGDGTGIRIASRIVRTPIVDNVNGTDMIFPLCDLCQRHKFRIYLLGSKPGVSEVMKNWMESNYPEILVAGHHHGYFERETESDDIVRMINESKADILLVGFSAPLQELWIDKHADALNCQVIMGVGGLFDVYAGLKPRPSKFHRALGIEWVGRLLHEPKRLWRRYLIGNPLFLFRVILWKYFGIRRRSMNCD